MRHSFMKNHHIQRGLSVPVILALVISLVAVTAVAYLIVSGSLTNKMGIAGEQSPTIIDDDGGYKVQIGEIGYSVYVRAAVTVNWVNGNHVYAISPALGTDYTVELGENWFYEGGFYYYKLPVESNKATAALVSNFERLPTAVVPADEGGNSYTLTLTMTAQTIQAKGTTDDPSDITKPGTPAVTDAWGISVDDNGNLVDPNP